MAFEWRMLCSHKGHFSSLFASLLAWLVKRSHVLWPEETAQLTFFPVVLLFLSLLDIGKFGSWKPGLASLLGLIISSGKQVTGQDLLFSSQPC